MAWITLFQATTTQAKPLRCISAAWQMPSSQAARTQPNRWWSLHVTPRTARISQTKNLSKFRKKFRAFFSEIATGASASLPCKPLKNALERENTMVEITARRVAELRAKTDAPMMECKKALTEADGNL